MPRGPLPDHSPEEARRIARRSFGNPEARVESCHADSDCDIPFIGMTVEDYAAHIVEHHPFYRSSTEGVLMRVVAEGISDTEVPA